MAMLATRTRNLRRLKSLIPARAPYPSPSRSPYLFRGFSDAKLPTDLFNRTQEINILSTVLKADPQLTVVTGPVNSGKSFLMAKILEGIKKDKTVPVLVLNLRNISFNSVESLVDTLTAKFSSWLSQFWQAAERLKLDGSAYGLDAKLSIDFEKPNIPPITKLNYLLELIGNKLPPQSFWYGRQTPILVIDEANELNALTKDSDGHDALTNLFKWLVLNTKEANRFHSLLVSSDSFFHLWVSNYVGASRFVNYVIGDLAKKDAETFWRERLLPQCNDVSIPLDFEDVYEICGGNIFLMKKFYWDYVIRSGMTQPRNFFMITQEKAKLTKALFSGETNNRPLWTRNQFLLIMEKLVNSETGFLNYNDICEEVGKAAVDSLIQDSLLHLRPTVSISNDLPDHKENIPVVTAETPCGLIAMKHMVQEKRALLKE